MIPADCAFHVCGFMSVPECLESTRLVSKSFHRASFWRLDGLSPWLLYKVRRTIRRWKARGQRRRSSSWTRRVYHPDDRVIL